MAMPLPGRPFATDAPLLLWGPSGAGKSTVGRLAAASLRVPFDDLDDLVERRAGAPVAAIFDRDGEAAFRLRERDELARILAEPRRRIVALGGGTLVDPDLRACALARAVVIGLRTPLETLATRLRGDTTRPLLGNFTTEAGRARLEALLSARSEAYATAHLHIDASRGPEAVASDVARVAGDRYAYVPSRGGGYPVRLTRDAGAGAADAAFALDATKRILVTDDRVAPIWADAVAATMAMWSLPVAGRLVFAQGEQHKRLATLETLADELSLLGADRRAALVCVGGGVVSDLGGLLAALFYRGIPWISVPTTLLSMVDAAVGGKTAVDLARVKNAIGAFHPPRAVVVDTAHARTETARQMRAGLAEAVKTALVGDPDLLDLMEREAEGARDGEPAVLDEIVARSLAVKIGVVTRDEHETGERAHLNLGHTLGHALEAAAGFETLLHGEGVAIGMCAALAVGEARGVTERGLSDRVRSLLDRLGLPTRAPRDLCGRAVGLVGADKKRLGREVVVVAVARPGVPTTMRLPLEEAASSLAEAAIGEETPPVF